MDRHTPDADPIASEQAFAALKATCSSDPDVLFARKQELLAGVRRTRVLATLQIAAGIAASLTMLGAVFGIPAVRRGLAMRKHVSESVAAVETAYTAYLEMLREKPKADPDWKRRLNR